MKKLTKILSCFLLFVLVGTFFASCSLFPKKTVVIIDNSEDEEEFNPENTLDMTESQLAISYIHNAAKRTINYIAENYINSFMPYADGLYWSNGEDILELEEDQAYFDEDGNADGEHYFCNNIDDVVCIWRDEDVWYCNSRIYSYNNDVYTITLTPIYDVGQIELGHNYLMVDINGLVEDLEKKFSAYLMSYILTAKPVVINNIFAQEMQGYEGDGGAFETFEEATSAFEQKYTDAQNNISGFESKYGETSSEFLNRVKKINSSGIVEYFLAGYEFSCNYVWNSKVILENTALALPIAGQIVWLGLAVLLWYWVA